jgi:hypothetical protein
VTNEIQKTRKLNGIGTSSASASDSLLFWLIAQEELPIRKRSNIDGADDVAGVFGSFNKTKTVSFFMKAKFPSLQKSKPR